MTVKIKIEDYGIDSDIKQRKNEELVLQKKLIVTWCSFKRRKKNEKMRT